MFRNIFNRNKPKRLYFPGQRKDAINKKIKALLKPFCKKYRLIKSVGVFISAQNKQLIITPQYVDKRGVTIEQETCYTYDLPIEYSILNRELRKCLDLFHYKNKVAIPDNKESHWPAYKASKCKTLKSFKEEYIFISIKSLNDSNLSLAIEGFPHYESELIIKSITSFPPPFENEDLAKKVFMIYDICRNKSFN